MLSTRRGRAARCEQIPSRRIFRTLSVSQCCRHIGAGLLAVSSLPVGLSRISRRPKWQIKRHRGNARAPASAPARGVGSAALSGPSVPPLVLPELGLPLLGPRDFAWRHCTRVWNFWVEEGESSGAFYSLVVNTRPHSGALPRLCHVCTLNTLPPLRAEQAILPLGSRRIQGGLKRE